LDDLCVRFIIHLPREDLSSVARICFQVEEAQWFYEDFIRPLDPTLPSMNLRSFCLRIFQHCPLLASFSVENHMRAFEEFLQYKTRVPVRGAILLNEAMDSTVLVKGWKKAANWSFPRGKINKDEDDLDCAIREVYEETGFDIRQAGLVPKDEDVKYIQISMREQQIRLYIFRNVPMDTVFEPKTRKEISKVAWYKLSELPAFRKKGNSQDNDAAAAASSSASKFYMVAPFLVPLKKWVVQQKKKDAARAAANHSHLAAQPPAEEPLTEDDIGAQTEPVPGPPIGPPAIETLEGATRELQRLLKVQPPTQGLQITRPAVSTENKGEALMALLRRSAGAPAESGSRQTSQLDAPAPDAQFDMPHSSYHQQSADRPPFPYYQPTTNFPIMSNPTLNNEVPGYAQSSRAPAQVPPPVYSHHQFVNAGQHHRNEPVLVHPQPLPPQVQQSLLTRGILPTPGLPDAAGQGGPQPQQGDQNLPATQRHDAYAPQHQPAKPAQLSGHAMALLNAFKSGPRDSAESKPRDSITQNDAPLQANNQHRYQWATRADVPASQASNPAAQYLPQYMVPAAPMKTSPRTVRPVKNQPGPKPVHPDVHSDPHRSALLDMFKRAGPKSPLSNEFRLRSEGTQEAAASTRIEEPRSSPLKATPATETITPASGANGAPVMMNSEASLPYRPMQILSRPKQAESGEPLNYSNTQAQMQHLQQRISPRGWTTQDARKAGLQGLPSPRDRVVSQPTEQEAKRSPRPNYAAAQAASLPYTQQSPSSMHAAPSFYQAQQPLTSVLQRRKDSNPEQKQKLLSLFSVGQQQQQQPSPAEDKGKGKEPAAFDQPQSLGGAPRSRVASLASASGTEPAAVGSASNSRRGSATPISPADRSFLFSYLQSMTDPKR
jgi:mRNA-decapping enzyme subunit 2